MSGSREGSKIITLVVLLIVLIISCGFFASSETALMAVNRYRMRHQARLKKRSAILVLKLLQRPDRLLGIILIGNTLFSVLCSAIATLISIALWGEQSVWIATLLLTLVLLVVGETAPKTLAALYPEKVAHIVAFPIYVLRQMFYPLIWLVNILSNSLLRLIGVKMTHNLSESLTSDELRTLVHETTGSIPPRYQSMLLGILDLNKLTVNDVMLPRRTIKGIDLNSSWDAIYSHLTKITQEWIPFYREDINHLVGILQPRDLACFLMEKKELNAETLLSLLRKPYFVPEQTPLNIQLHNFQKKHEQIAFVVDEYGEILGALTLDDILEEIVGEFTINIVEPKTVIQIQSDGSYLVDGMLPVREFNRFVHWDLPITGPHTMSGLITEYLESLPRPGICVLIQKYPIEIIEVKANRVKTARIFPRIL